MRQLLSRLVILFVLAPGSAGAQEPQTRADALREERTEKAKHVQPQTSGRMEKLLLALENGRLFERVLNPPEGWYPKIGNITPGSGFAVGPAYRHPGLIGGHVDASAFAAASFKKYWLVEGRLRMPRFADGRVLIDAHAQRSEFPEEPFFGLGPASARANEVTYGLTNTVIGATAGYTPLTWLTLGGTLDRLSPGIIRANASPGSILSVFSDADAPGLTSQPDYMRYEAKIDVNTRLPRGNPRRGGQYVLTYQNFDDLDDDSYAFERVEADVQHYVPFLNDRRVIALRALASISDANAGARIPFYLERTLGGPDDLRGFRRFRFRDENMILLQAEYRWEIFTAMDGAIFYDAGKVASRTQDVNFKDLETDYGIGFRFGTKNGVFLRVEGAFGSSAGKHFILRFGNVF